MRYKLVEAGRMWGHTGIQEAVDLQLVEAGHTWGRGTQGAADPQLVVQCEACSSRLLHPCRIVCCRLAL